ncbi:hypothetical protein SAMN04490248_1624 [Salinihabitans flavidus]|uniref:Uncharacterized protein n=1 Tax=Salinihabitans flavidus TaxID=569882 RepID=A0A1H8WGS4_9RHOB|nr:hypothetical protein SAMN04490248_1624 [Salinihabitans flavidus]
MRMNSLSGHKLVRRHDLLKQENAEVLRSHPNYGLF